MTLEESHFQVAKMPKSAWHETCCPGVVHFRTRKESLFQDEKNFLIGINDFFSKVS
jgi:hypothetical protein